MTDLAHSDHILKARPGEVVMACEPVSAVNMGEGGRIHYQAGAQFRVKHTVADLLWCFDSKARTVSFAGPDMKALERADRGSSSR